MQNDFNPQYIKSANIKLDRELSLAEDKYKLQVNNKNKTKESLTIYLKIKRFFKRLFS